MFFLQCSIRCIALPVENALARVGILSFAEPFYLTVGSWGGWAVGGWCIPCPERGYLFGVVRRVGVLRSGVGGGVFRACVGVSVWVCGWVCRGTSRGSSSLPNMLSSLS